MIYLLITIIILLLILCVFLFIRAIGLVKRMESYEDVIVQFTIKEVESERVLQLMLKQMRDIDIKGAFEADDEVGSVFNELKQLIETYNNPVE